MMFHESKTGTFAAAAVILSAVFVSDAITMDEGRDAHEQWVQTQFQDLRTSQAFQDLKSRYGIDWEDISADRIQDLPDKTMFTILLTQWCKENEHWSKVHRVFAFERSKHKVRVPYSRRFRPDEIRLTGEKQLPQDEPVLHWGALSGSCHLLKQKSAEIDAFSGNALLVLTPKKLYVYDDALAFTKEQIDLEHCGEISPISATEFTVSDWSFRHTDTDKIRIWQQKLSEAITKAKEIFKEKQQKFLQAQRIEANMNTFKLGQEGRHRLLQALNSKSP